MGNKRESVFQTLERIKKNWPGCWEKILPEVLMFFRLEEQLEKSMQLALEQFGIQRGDFEVLFHLRIGGDPDYTLTPTDIYTRLGLSSGGLTKILHRIEEKGLIKRVSNLEDRRSTKVQLSPKGEKLLCRGMDKINESDQGFFSALSANERATLRQLFKKLINANL